MMMDKVTAHLPFGGLVTEKQMMYLYHSTETGILYLDYCVNGVRFITVTSHDYTHTEVDSTHVFTINAAFFQKIADPKTYSQTATLGNQLRNPLRVD